MLVGGTALAAGLFFLLTQGLSSAAGIFDAVLGVAILIIGWLFLGPMLAPSYFGDRAPDEPAIERSYLRLPIVSPMVEPTRSTVEGWVRTPPPAPASRPTPPAAAALTREPAIPRWADPMVQRSSPRRTPNPPPAPAPRATRAIQPEDYLEGIDTVGAPPPPTPRPPARNSLGAMPATGESARAGLGSAPPEVIQELDLISAELREPRRRPVDWGQPSGVGDSARRTRGGGADSGAGETMTQDDAGFEPF